MTSNPSDPGYTYTQGHDPSVVRAHSSRTAAKCAAFLLLHIKSTDKILDVGCGPGTISLGLAAAAANGQVVAIDYSTDVIELAKQNAQESKVGNCEFRQGDAYDLKECGDGEFDVVYAHQCLIHLGDPARALREMRRVCKAGGIIGVREADFGLMAIHPDPSSLIAASITAHASVLRTSCSEPLAGRHLLSWALSAGFARENIVVSGSVDLSCTPEERCLVGTAYADRFERSELGRRVVEAGLGTREEVEAWRDAWKGWVGEVDGWYAVTQTEIRCRNGEVGTVGS